MFPGFKQIFKSNFYLWFYNMTRKGEKFKWLKDSSMLRRLYFIFISLILCHSRQVLSGSISLLKPDMSSNNLLKLHVGHLSISQLLFQVLIQYSFFFPPKNNWSFPMNSTYIPGPNLRLKRYILRLKNSLQI